MDAATLFAEVDAMEDVYCAPEIAPPGHCSLSAGQRIFPIYGGCDGDMIFYLMRGNNRYGVIFNLNIDEAELDKQIDGARKILREAA